VFPGDREHRRRIFALAGEQGPKVIRVRVAQPKTAPAVQLDLLGRLGRAFSNAEAKMENGESETGESVATAGTLGTTTYSLRVREESEKDEINIRKLIDNREAVPSVPVEVRPPISQQSETGVPNVPTEKNIRLPYLTPS